MYLKKFSSDEVSFKDEGCRRRLCNPDYERLQANIGQTLRGWANPVVGTSILR